MAEKKETKEAATVEEPVPEISKKRKISYDAEEEARVNTVSLKSLRKTFFEFICNPRECLIECVKVAQKYTYKSFIEEYFKRDDNMNCSDG